MNLTAEEYEYWQDESREIFQQSDRLLKLHFWSSAQNGGILPAEVEHWLEEARARNYQRTLDLYEMLGFDISLV